MLRILARKKQQSGLAAKSALPILIRKEYRMKSRKAHCREEPRRNEYAQRKSQYPNNLVDDI
jgi:hypothetical protein